MNGSDSDSSRTSMLSSAMTDSSLLDPTAIEEKAVEGARHVKRALAAAKDKAGLKLSGGLAAVDLIRGNSGSQCTDGGHEWQWGRAMNKDWTSAVLAFAMMSVVPWIVLLMLHSCRYHQCSIQDSLQQALKEGQWAARQR